MTSRGTSSGRDSLLTAAGRVLRERGVQGLRVREVAAAAGMSPAAVIYHYKTTNDLLFAVHGAAVGEYTKLRTAAARAEKASPTARLLACFKVGVPPYTDSALIELLYEMHGLTRRSPRHAILLTDLWHTELALYEEIVADGISQRVFDPDDPAAAARALLALEDGLVLHSVSDNEFMTSSLVLTTFANVAAQLLKCPALSLRSR